MFCIRGAGSPLNAHFAIGNFIQDALTAEQITVFGDGTPLRIYLDQSDLAHWLCTLMNDGVDGEAYNVGSDRFIRIADLAYLACNLLAPHESVHILGVSDVGASRNRYIPCIEKIQALHGLRPRVTLELSIKETANASLIAHKK